MKEDSSNLFDSLKPLFSIAYLPPVSYLLKCNASREIILEQHEHFVKQSYRNRCCIAGPNGKQLLVIPVLHENIFRTPIKEVKISHATSWKKIHWKSIESAYRNSPFFEYFEDDFKELYDEEEEFLFRFNLKLMNTLFRIFGISTEVKLTDSYQEQPSDVVDYRNSIHPKHPKEMIRPYHQVFIDRNGFINDLSSIDLLFNEGPEALRKLV